MNTPSAVGCVYMFCCGTNACERRMSLPVAASSTYTNPVLPASTTAFLPPTIAITGGLTHADRPPVCQASAYFPASAFSFARSRFRSSPSGVVLENGPHQPPSSGDGSVYQVQTSCPLAALNAFT